MESYIPPEKEDGESFLDCCSNLKDKMQIQWAEAKSEGRLSAYLFALIWIIINISIFGVYAEGKGWPALGKGMSQVLNLNLAFMVLPVSENLISFLHNQATLGYDVCTSKILRQIPLGFGLPWHKFMCYIVIVASIFHWLAYGIHGYQNYDSDITILGGVLILILVLIVSTAVFEIRGKRHEQFLFFHFMFIFFYIILIAHGSDHYNHMFWRFAIFPGVIWILDRLYRYLFKRRMAGVVSVCHFHGVPDVPENSCYCVEIQKPSNLKNFDIGQFVYLKSGTISKLQWHPVYIASAPRDINILFFILVQGEDTWTHRLQRYLQAMSGLQGFRRLATESHTRNSIVARTTGVDGNSILSIDGPYYSPVQYMTQYEASICIATGISVSSLRSALYELVFHKYKYDSGNIYPRIVEFHWVVPFSLVVCCRFMCRTFSEIEEQISELQGKGKNSAGKENMSNRGFKFHVWVIDIPHPKPIIDISQFRESSVDNYGVEHGTGEHLNKIKKVSSVRKPEFSFLEAMVNQPKKMDHIEIHHEEPSWPNILTVLAEQVPETKIGLCLNTNEHVTKDIRKALHMVNSSAETFVLHRDNVLH